MDSSSNKKPKKTHGHFTHGKVHRGTELSGVLGSARRGVLAAPSRVAADRCAGVRRWGEDGVAGQVALVYHL